MLRPSNLRVVWANLFSSANKKDNDEHGSSSSSSTLWSSCHRRRRVEQYQQRHNTSLLSDESSEGDEDHDYYKYSSGSNYKNYNNNSLLPVCVVGGCGGEESSSSSSWSSSSLGDIAQAYTDFSKTNPFVNNILIATTKSGLADFMTQTVLMGSSLDQVNVRRFLLFCFFGAFYIGAFQYLYQVQVFKKLFDLDKFTKQSWADKIRNRQGLRDLALQTLLDLAVLSSVYLPTFYVFKAIIYSSRSSSLSSLDPAVWVMAGLHNFQSNLWKDEMDLITFWLPTDLICFSVPLHWRLPLRHALSFVWMLYLSFSRGGRSG